ncbi:uncharacterized protein LOC119449016 [Dermacentor silvarum]|uniref:uncharacterized protein LOC119449016 n=1 Tax=Dermacentor silvarum TaxID=543639 RepID=UPI001899A350|nr:uncharacterized protein LOC119449016 [Dermacentor silvarum]
MRKRATTILIPNPSKPHSLENLRPISLTSCVGKVTADAIHNRVFKYLEDKDIYLQNMIRFRAGLLTQDAMKVMKDQVIDRNMRDRRAIFGLDFEKALDILHSFVLRTISSLRLGKHFHNYKRSFLADREAILKVGDLASDSVRLGSRRTPQGSMTLINLAMIGLLRKLSEVDGIHHTIYADDVPYGAPVAATDA